MIATLPRWDVSDVHASVTARSFVDDTERLVADITRLEVTFDDHDVRAVAPRAVTGEDGRAADAVLDGWNDASRRHQVLAACARAAVATNSRDDSAVAVASELEGAGARLRALLARLASWVDALDARELATVSDAAREHAAPWLVSRPELPTR